jgi:hypothetical protein
MSLSFPDPGVLVALGPVVLLCLLGVAANLYGSDSRPTESTDRDPSGPLGHSTGHHV